MPGGRGRILLGSILLLLLPRSRWRNRPLLSRACSWRRRRTQSGGSRRTKAPWIKKRRWGFEIATKKLIFFRSRLSHQQRSRRLRHHLQASSSAQFTSFFSWCTHDTFSPPVYFFCTVRRNSHSSCSNRKWKRGILRSMAPFQLLLLPLPFLFRCWCCPCPWTGGPCAPSPAAAVKRQKCSKDPSKGASELRREKGSEVTDSKRTLGWGRQVYIGGKEERP